MKLFKSIKALNKRTKIEAVALILLMVVISISSVFGGPGDRSPDLTYIWNENGESWVPNASNLQDSLNHGGVTYFPATTIYTNKTITMPSNSSLIGWGTRSILKADAGLGPNHELINNTNQKNGNVNLEVRNLVLDGSTPIHPADQNYSLYGLYWKKVSNGTVDTVWVKDTGKDGIRFETCDNCSASHINTHSTGHHAVMFCYGTSYSSMSDLIITDSYRESAIVEHYNHETGERNHDITITNVITKNCGQYGIFVRDAYAVTVTGCITEYSDDNGFYAGNCSDIIFTNCITNNNKDHAGFIVNISANGVILSNCIARHAGYRSDSRGFELRGQNIQVSNCAVYDTKTPFFFYWVTSKNITISLCNIVNYSKQSSVRGDNIRFRDNTFLTRITTPYVLDIAQNATNIQVIGNDFKYAYTTSRKINDPSGNAIIRDNIGDQGLINAPPVFGSPSPGGGSTEQPLNLTWSIPISDPNGDTFSWSIQCSNGQSTSASGGSNGTKSLVLAGLAYLTTYKVWVNATDPTGSGDYTREWYIFTTLQQSGTEILDQQQINYSLNYSMYTTRWDGQSFRPSLEVLSSVDLYMRRVGSPPSDVTLSVRSSLTGSDLVSISIPPTSISTSYGWVKFDFSDLNVTTGHTYYLILRTLGGSSSNRYYWGYDHLTSYTNGIRVFSTDGGTTWVSNPSYDNCFKTYGI